MIVVGRYRLDDGLLLTMVGSLCDIVYAVVDVALSSVLLELLNLNGSRVGQGGISDFFSGT